MRRLTSEAAGYPLTATLYGEGSDTLLVCLPGGGASARYFDLREDHSFAREMVARGYDVLTVDHPGTATNPLPDNHAFLTPRIAADHLAGAIGEWSVGYGRVVGLGHSMGGMSLVLVQARHRPFAALAILGSSCGGLDWGLSEAEREYKDKPAALTRDLEALTLAKFKTSFPPPLSGPSGKSITFGGATEDLSAALREATCSLFAAGGMMSMTKGSFAAEAAAIDVPILFAFGDHDIGIPPADVPADFPNAPSGVMVLADTGHNHFAFPSMHRFVQRFSDWDSALMRDRSQ